MKKLGEGRKMNRVNNMWHISKISARAAHGFYIYRRVEAALPASWKSRLAEI